MNRKNLITSTCLLTCCGLLAGCPESPQSLAAAGTETEGRVAPENEGPGEELGAQPCLAKPTLMDPADFVDREFEFREPPPEGVHLNMGQTMHVLGPVTVTTPTEEKEFYVLTPVSSATPHHWPTGVGHVATKSTVENEYCIRTIINNQDHPGSPHQFIFRVLSNDPPEFCIQRPHGDQCGPADGDEHVAAAHGGSADLF